MGLGVLISRLAARLWLRKQASDILPGCHIANQFADASGCKEQIIQEWARRSTPPICLQPDASVVAPTSRGEWPSRGLSSGSPDASSVSYLEGLQGGIDGESLPAFSLHGACSAAECLQMSPPVGNSSFPWIEALRWAGTPCNCPYRSGSGLWNPWMHCKAWLPEVLY